MRRDRPGFAVVRATRQEGGTTADLARSARVPLLTLLPLPRFRFDAPLPAGGRPTFDLYPDLSSHHPSELYPAPGVTNPSGSPAHLFSSRHPLTVARHFAWMRQHRLSGVFLQRFIEQVRKEGDMLAWRDEIGERVKEAAEREGRVWAIMWDLSCGMTGEEIIETIKKDWKRLVVKLRVTSSSQYLHEGGRPVVALWGALIPAPFPAAPATH